MRLQCLFLDRDGVINQERVDYVKTWQEMEILPGALEAIARLTHLGVPLILITNQSAIGRQRVTRSTVDELHRQLVDTIQKAGGRLDDIFLCPHHPDLGCDCRKPQPGLLIQAAQKYKLELSECLFIGDSVTDFQAAAAVGCQSILVRSGRQGQRLESLINRVIADSMTYPLIVTNLSEAVNCILAKLKSK